jgi:Flp pilus assembly protein TadG
VRRLSKFWRDQRGNTAIIFGLAAIPLLALGGGAVDFAHRHQVRAELQAAADTAALAAARILQEGQMDREEDWDVLKAKAEDTANRMLAAALAEVDVAGTPAIDIDLAEDALTISANYDVDTNFLGLIGIETLRAGALAEVNLPDPILVEIALVLDYSGSMADNNKYVRMTSAARGFIGKVKADRSDRSKIGIVPFSEYVYATMPGRYLRGTDIADANTPMTVCLLNRDYPYSATDEAPYTGNDESKWRFIESSEAQCEEYDDGGLRVRDLTSEFDELDNALAGMEPVGLTNIALATEIGWHMLSPDAPLETGRPYTDEDMQKILIVLTDGMQTVSALGPSGETSTLAADGVTAEICDGAKAAGVRIFTIAFDIDTPRIQELLSNCASGPANYFDARESSDISSVFDIIYAQIAESAWLSK